jgi:stalled ribosome alternative rescue factor ArfA
MSKKVPVSDLPIMPVFCKTCPFKQNERGVFQDNKLASKVIERTLFKSQQLCHKDAYLSENQFRCKGSWDYNFEIYNRLGFSELIK